MAARANATGTPAPPRHRRRRDQRHPCV